MRTMDHQPQGNLGGFDPNQFSEEDWNTDFLDGSIDPAGPYSFAYHGNVGNHVSNFPGNPAVAEHQGLGDGLDDGLDDGLGDALSDPSVAPDFGAYHAGRFIPQGGHFNQGIDHAQQYGHQPQLAPAYTHQQPMHFGAGHASHVQTGPAPDGHSHNLAAVGAVPFNQAPNGYTQPMPVAQHHWQGHPAGNMVSAYGNNQSFTGSPFQQVAQRPEPQRRQSLEHTQQQMLQARTASVHRPQIPAQESFQYQGPQQASQQASHRLPQQAPQQIDPQFIHDVAQPTPTPVQGPVQPSSAPAPAANQARGSVEVPSGQPSRPSTSGSARPRRIRLQVPDTYLRTDQNVVAMMPGSDQSFGPGDRHLLVGSNVEQVPKVNYKQLMLPVLLKPEKKKLFPQRTLPIPADILTEFMEKRYEAIRRHVEGKITELQLSNKFAMLENMAEYQLSLLGRCEYIFPHALRGRMIRWLTGSPGQSSV